MEALAPEKILEAYRLGWFPMGNPFDDGIQWYHPDPRAILPLDGLRVSRSLRQRCRSGRFEVSTNTCFEKVIDACAEDRPRWISPAIRTAYVALHRAGHVHSVEATRGRRLVGGLYGVHVGGAFMGESMFHRDSDAGKVCMVALVAHLRKQGFALLDTQMATPVMQRLGAVDITAADYLRRLREAVRLACSWGPPGPWPQVDRSAGFPVI